MKKLTGKHLLMGLTMSVLMGSSLPIMKLGMKEMSPFLFAALRSACVIPFLFFIPRPSTWKPVILVGIFVGVFKMGLLMLGLHLGLAAGLASLLSHTQIFFTLLIAIFYLKEWPTMQNWMALVLAFAGICLITLTNNNVATMLGILAVLGSSFAWALSNIVTRQAKHLNVVHLTMWMNIIPPIPLILFACLVDSPAAIYENFTNMTGITIFAFCYGGLVVTLCGYSLWGTLLRAYPVSMVAPFSLMVPAFGMIFSFILLGEIPTTIRFIGAGLVFTGLILNQFSLKKKIIETTKIIED
ncbi:MAG: EamA family transporter [Alphaproteobacteria bacterium]